jgi:hypothetical protein
VTPFLLSFLYLAVVLYLAVAFGFIGIYRQLSRIADALEKHNGKEPRP